MQHLQLQRAGGHLLLRRWLSRRPLGQPTAYTHPELLRESEILPGIDRSEFAQRRTKFMVELSKSHTGMTHPRHLAVVPAAPIKYRYTDIPHQFHQNPDFLYLTGFVEPSAVLLLVSDEARGLPHHRSILYVQPRSIERELWDGPRTGPEDAVDFLGVDEAYSIDDLEVHLSNKYAPLHYAVWHYSNAVVNVELQKTVAKALGKQEAKIKAVHNLVPYLDAVKAIKSQAEVELLRGACRIAGHAFKATMAGCHPGLWEYQLESLMEHAARMRGARSLSFPPVVAGGTRGNHIHYIRNDHQLKNGDLVLMDAGADYHGYVSDITRTWPVNGCFTSPQRDLYDGLLEVQKEAVKKCKPGSSLNHLHHETTVDIGRMLKVLGIASPRATDESLFQLSNDLFPHHLGHYLGVETHDTQSVSRSLQLLPGMVVTVEPGVYLPTDFTSHLLGPQAEHFKGMAIRIEDNVLLTDSGNEVLSACCPKEVEEMEALVGTAPVTLE